VAGNDCYGVGAVVKGGSVGRAYFVVDGSNSVLGARGQAGNPAAGVGPSPCGSETHALFGVPYEERVGPVPASLLEGETWKRGTDLRA
jgi:hypothetical protein